jgi:hypothetical protein
MDTAFDHEVDNVSVGSFVYRSVYERIYLIVSIDNIMLMGAAIVPLSFFLVPIKI